MNSREKEIYREVVHSVCIKWLRLIAIIFPLREVRSFLGFLMRTNTQSEDRVDNSTTAYLSLSLSLFILLSMRPTIVGSLTCDLVSGESILYESMRTDCVSWITLKTSLLVKQRVEAIVRWLSRLRVKLCYIMW